MSTRRKIVITTALLVGCLIIGGITGLIINRNPVMLVDLLKPRNIVNDINNPTIKGYLSANILPFHAAPNISPKVKAWDTVLNADQSPSIRIMATGMISGKFVAKYSDEQSERIIGQPGDYISPSDLRFDMIANKVYAKANGLAAGVYQDTILFEFDIKSRKTTNIIHVNPTILPYDPSI